MKRHAIAFLLALALSLQMALPAYAAGGEPGYTDVPEESWCADSVERATELGLFQGIGDGRFGRGEPITRAAFVTALVRLFGWEAEKSAQNTFSDVTDGRWFYSAVETAYANGAVAASDHTFRPTDDITRGEMVTMLVRGLGYTALAGTVSGYSSPFTDVTTNRGFITVAYDMGLVDGIGDGKFAPDGTATREQAAALLVRVYDRLNAQSVRLTRASGYTQITVPAPLPKAGDEIPTTPLEPLTELYSALRELRGSGADLTRTVLCLSAGGVRTIVSGGSALTTDTLSAQEVASILSTEDVNTYYSDRYESAYCIYAPNRYQEATVWYQSPESLAAKLQMARLFGVTQYVMT